MDLVNLSVAELQTRLDHKDLTPQAIMDAYRDRIRRLNPTYNIYLAWDREPGRDMPGESGALRGVPAAIKDMVDVGGWTTTGGSKFFRKQPSSDAWVVGRMRAAGAGVLGKANTHEFAAGGTTINPHFGPTRNPWDPSRIVGGSSGGSAAAVAARMALVAIGTDDAGSVRIPACLCGIVGLKPTFGRVGRTGVIPLSWSLDHVGPLTRTVDDCAVTYRVMAGHDPNDLGSVANPPATLPIPERGRVGVVTGTGSPLVDEEVAKAVQTAADWLSQSGMTVRELELPQWQSTLAANFTILRSETSALHQDWFSEHAGDYGEDVRTYIETGLRISAVDYLKALRMRGAIIETYRELFGEVDYLLTPTVPKLPPPIEGYQSHRFPLTQFTVPFDLTGLPALTVPMLSSGRLPIGLQLVAPWWQEEWLFPVGRTLEQARGPMPEPF